MSEWYVPRDPLAHRRVFFPAHTDGHGSDQIESPLATVPPRHGRTNRNGSRAACLVIVFKLCEFVSRKRRALNGAKLLPEVILGVGFVDGETAEKDAA